MTGHSISTRGVNRVAINPLAFRAATLFLALVWIGALQPAGAQAPPLSFETVLSAQWHTPYVGLKRTTVTGGRRSGSVEAQVVQKANGLRMITVVAPPRRRGEVQVDDGAYLWHYTPARNSIDISPSKEGRHLKRGQHNQPVLSPLGTDTVAGRPTVIYNVAPVRAEGPMLRWWVDNQTLVPLRTELATRDGRQINEVYESIDFNRTGEVQFIWPNGAPLLVHTWKEGGGKGPMVEMNSPLALPRPLPAHLVLDGIWARELAGRQVLWLHFHRGKRYVSIFESTFTPRGPIPQGDAVDNWTLGPLNITMVSDMAPAARARLRSTIEIIHQ